MLEAMACGCVLVASDTTPVREVLRDGENGWMVDFFDADGIADCVGRVLEVPEGSRHLRLRASQLVREHFSLQRGVWTYRALLGLHG